MAEAADGLASGAKVAVIGGGLCAAAAGIALSHAARARGRTIEVVVFEGPRSPGRSERPVIVSPECRARLSALGCPIPNTWCARELRGIEVISHGRSELIPVGPGELWVVDDWEEGEHGRELLLRTLTASAALEGARFVPLRVDRVERHSPHKPPARDAPDEGGLVLCSQGRRDRFHAALLTTPQLVRRDRADGLRGPPDLPAIEMRVACPSGYSPPPLLRLLLSCGRGVDGLYLIPCRRSLHAVAFGPALSEGDFFEALMIASRDGFLPDGFRPLELRARRIPLGAGTRLVGPGQLAIGPAALGNPLQLGLSEALATCTRAAIALLDAGLNTGRLERRFITDGVLGLLEGAVTGARALAWLRRAHARAPEAFLAAMRRDGPLARSRTQGGILGLPSPTPRALLTSARSAGLRERVRAAFPARRPPPPPRAPGAPGLVFVVEDDTSTREALARYLGERGVEVVALGDELALFSAASRRPPTAIVLDVVLHRVDGLRLCERLKQHPLTRGARIVVTSGLDRPHVRAGALQAGADAYLPKPIDPAQLWAVLAADGRLEGDLRPSADPRPAAAREG